MLNGIVNTLRRNLYRAWKVASIATSLASLIFFSIFFLYMIFGYTVYLLEPNAMIAAAEMFLCLSALIFQAKSLKVPNPLKLIFKYPYFSLAILQYLDFFSTALDYLTGHGHELNPILVSPFSIQTILFKLAIFPGLLFFLHFRHYKSRFKIVLNALLIIYLIVVISNFLGAFNL